MLESKDIITGEKLQDLAGVSISKEEHRPFESKTKKWIEVDSFNLEQPYNNPDRVYINSSLFNKTKPKLVSSKILDKLAKFNNPCDLILHNSDQDFDIENLDVFDIPNIKRVYTQNINLEDDRVIPLPIGLANSCWKHGDLGTFCKIANTYIPKNNLIYNNFTVKGGMRPEYRVPCEIGIEKYNLPKQTNKPYKEFLKELISYKFCLCPSGNGLDTHRFWESLYLRTIPIVVRIPLYTYFSKFFPILIVDSWDNIPISELESIYKEADWSNYDLLKFKNYIKYFKLL